MALQMKKMEATAPQKKKKSQSSAIGIHVTTPKKARGPTKLHQNKQKEMKINILLQMKKRKVTPREKRLRMMTPQRKVPTLQKITLPKANHLSRMTSKLIFLKIGKNDNRKSQERKSSDSTQDG